MLFSSNIFLFLFLPLTLAGYYLLKKSYRNIFLLLMSLIFYAWGEPKSLSLNNITFTKSNKSTGETEKPEVRRSLFLKTNK